jgi:hypothetical protein
VPVSEPSRGHDDTGERVDVKVAALDEDWSGLRLLWRAERRQTS